MTTTVAMLQYHNYSNSRVFAIVSVDVLATVSLDFLATGSFDFLAIVSLNFLATVSLGAATFFFFLTCIKIKQKSVTI